MAVSQGTMFMCLFWSSWSWARPDELPFLVFCFSAVLIDTFAMFLCRWQLRTWRKICYFEVNHTCEYPILLVVSNLLVAYVHTHRLYDDFLFLLPPLPTIC